MYCIMFKPTFDNMHVVGIAVLNKVTIKLSRFFRKVSGKLIFDYDLN